MRATWLTICRSEPCSRFAIIGGRHAGEQKEAGTGCFLVPELVPLLLSA
jgi:hypothetical protein